MCFVKVGQVSLALEENPIYSMIGMAIKSYHVSYHVTHKLLVRR